MPRFFCQFFPGMALKTERGRHVRELPRALFCRQADGGALPRPAFPRSILELFQKNRAEERHMKNYRDSDYALNRNRGGIAYRFADGIVEVTPAAYLAENPGRTAADFAALKALSDSDYLESDRRDCRQTRKNTPLGALGGADSCAAPSPEAAVIDAPEEAARQRRRLALAKRALGALTGVQRRRYLMRRAGGLTMREIAKKEGVNHSKVQKSLAAAERKIKKVLSEG
jgi:DNA-binding CsgD family transcriptional regulator